MKNNVRKYRKELGITQNELAIKANVSRTVISQLENETREIITSGTMMKLSSALGKSVKDIFLA